MADYSMYHALGQGATSDERQQPAISPSVQSTPSAAPPQTGYQQTGTYGIPPQSSQPAYGTPQSSSFVQSPNAGYAAAGPPLAPGQSDGHAIAGLASQMGGLGITADSGSRGHKKKHRHAYHDISGPVGSLQTSNGMPHAAAQNSAQFLDNTTLDRKSVV